MHFLIETGKGRKNSYRQKRYEFNSEQRAITHFNCLNTHNGYKKRISVIKDDGTKRVLARVITD